MSSTIHFFRASALAFLVCAVVGCRETTTVAEPGVQTGTAAQWLDYLRALPENSPAWGPAQAHANAAVERLGANAVPALTEALRDKRWQIRGFAVSALSRCGEHALPALPQLVRALRDEHFLVQEAADFAVGNICLSSDRALRKAVEMLSDPDPVVRADLAVQFGELGRRATPALPELQKLTKDPDARVRDAATAAVTAIETGP